MLSLLTCDIRENKTADGFLILSGGHDPVFPAAGQPGLEPGQAGAVLQLRSVPQPLDGGGRDWADTAGQARVGTWNIKLSQSVSPLVR